MLAAKWQEFRRGGIALIGNDLALFEGGFGRFGPIMKYEQYVRKAESSVDPVDPEREETWMLDEIFQNLQGIDCDTVIISAENFCHIGGIGKNGRHGRAALLKALKREFDLHIIVYIRRQDTWCEAAWKQWWIRTSDTDYWTSILQHVVMGIPSFLLELNDLESLVGKDRLHARLLSQPLLKENSLIADFLSILGLSAEGAEDLFHNKSPPNEVTNLLSARYLSTSKQYDDALFALLDELGDVKSERLLVQEQRRKVMGLFRQENEAMLAQYFQAYGPAGREYFWLDDAMGACMDTEAGINFQTDPEIMRDNIARLEARLRNTEETVSILLRTLARLNSK